MAKQASAGEMRTRITVKKPTRSIDAEGFRTETWTDLFGGMTRCKWVYAHGAEVIEHKRQELGHVATITMRYTPLIDETCRVWKENDTQDAAHAWEVISVNDPEDRHAFLEITVRREVVA
jgi:head-tail adaptor